MSTDAIQRLPVDFGRLLKQRLVERGWEPARFAASAGKDTEPPFRLRATGRDHLSNVLKPRR